MSVGACSNTVTEEPHKQSRIQSFEDQETTHEKHLTFLRTEGTSIKNENNEEIILRGFYYNAFYPLPDSLKDIEKIDVFARDISKHYASPKDIETLKTLHVNVVCIPFS